MLANTAIELEIGMGRAHYLFERAAQVPDRQIVGVEWKIEWVRQAEKRMLREGIYNVTPIHGNAWEVVPKLFGPNMLDGIHLNFPDPWWKRRHHKRRVLNENFLNQLIGMMKPGAFFFFQSDVPQLFEIYAKLLESKLKRVTCEDNPIGARSHREKKCLENGLPIYRILLLRTE